MNVVRTCAYCSIVNTSLETVYRTAFDYDAVAGVGSFNGSYVNPFVEAYRNNQIDRHDVVPYTTLALASHLVSDPSHSIAIDAVNCSSKVCDSFFISGGLPLSWPWPPRNYSDLPVILLKSVPGTHIQFQRHLDNEIPFDDDDCDTYYEENYLIAIRFCTKTSTQSPGLLHAGECMAQNWVNR